MTCKHAIILVAGYGTRRLPVTKAVEKCMMPLLDRPVVDYVVEDCIKAGIEHIIFLTSEGSTQFKDYYSRHAVLERYLREHGKEQYIEAITPPESVIFDFVEQSNELLFSHYGTNTAVAMCRPLIPKGESALVLMGDGFLYGENGNNPIAEMIEQTPEGVSAAMAIEVPTEEISKYGILALDKEEYLDHMVEKPQPSEAPSNLANLAEYILTSELLDESIEFFNEPVDGHKEKYINLQPFDRYMSKGGKIKAIRAEGKFLDAGTLQGWLRANKYLAERMNIVY